MSKRERIPADCEFAQLHEISDSEKLAAKLEKYVTAFSGRQTQHVSSCKIEQLHYRPGRDCKLLLRVRLTPVDEVHIEEQLYFGWLLTCDPKTKEYVTQVAERELAIPGYGPPMLYIPEWGLMLAAYPNDPELAGPALMSDDDRVLALMQEAPEKFGLTEKPEGFSSKITKYIPSLRCGYLYEVKTEAEAAPVAAVYGKAYRAEEGEKAFAIMKQIWASPACQKGELHLPQPFSYDTEAHVLWQEALPGRPFVGMVECIPNLPEVAREIGRCLAALHNSTLQLPVEMTLDFQVREVQEAVLAISQTFPQVAEHCKAVGEKLLERAATLGPWPLTPVHASFKFSHIFMTPRGVAFIDFDSANLGDPGYDLGRFIAHLYKMKAGFKLAPEAANETIASFITGYNEAAARPLPRERIQWFAASHVLGSQVYKAVKRLDADLVNKLLKTAALLCPVPA